MPNEPVSMYIYKYPHLHFLSSGCRPHQEAHPFTIQDFIASLDTKLRRKIANKYSDHRSKPRTLERALEPAVPVADKLQVADSLE